MDEQTFSEIRPSITVGEVETPLEVEVDVLSLGGAGQTEFPQLAKAHDVSQFADSSVQTHSLAATREKAREGKTPRAARD
ncbi:MAG: hypothetical protein JKY65_00315 [Planctomycetes bacterium]|nr:hypothetical protein [Planctomycetota bacterium]